MRFILYIFGAAIVAGLFGFLVYWILAKDYAYSQVLQHLTSMTTFATVSGTSRYGIVESVDVENSRLTIRSADQFGSEQDSVLLTLSVTPLTYIGFEELLEEGGSYTALSNPRQASLKDISPGTRVKFRSDRAEGALTARLILFGNPL